ncbi:MAG: MFS transporter [Candidatus Omnitrophica bacterium]|nr:MFS transporter [Candidatus Omnitrophota bacterium]
MFSSLKVRNFRIYWLGMLVSLIGTWIQQVTQSWLVFQLTNSAFLLGLVGFLNSIPVLLLSLFGGVLADRINKRVILITTQIAFMILAFLLAVLTQFKIITPLQIMFIAVLNGIIMAFDAPSRQAVVVELVGKTHLPNAIALNSVAFSSSRIIGPALAGILVATIGMSGCFYINGASFLAVILALFYIRINSNILKAREKSSAFRDLKEGLVFVKNNRLILALISLVAVASLFGVAHLILMPIFANDILKVGIKGLGVLMSSAGAGALIGGLVLARLGDFKYKARFLTFASLLFSISLILFSLSRVYLLSSIALVLVGAASVMSIALVNTILQTKVEDKFRGRVMSVFMLTFAGMMPFGNLLSGILAQKFGAPFTVLASGIACTVLFIAINIIYPDLRKI